ncbi:MAG: hypothetical protein K2J82_09615 [Muribaculaceae bacterium]|nr:hypothetical protein [Muribaculaceae bacterium]
MFLKILFSLSLFLSSSILVFSNPTANQPNPILIGVNLIEQTSSAEAADYCRYYNLSEQNSSDSACEFMASDGSNLYYYATGTEFPQKVVVTTTVPIKDIIKTIESCGFSKSNNRDLIVKDKDCIVYSKGTKLSSVITLCVISKKKPLKVTIIKQRISDVVN